MSILNAACHKVTRPMGYDNIRVWRRDFEMARKHAISLANEDFGVFLLNEEYYNDKYGVVREAEMPLLLM